MENQLKRGKKTYSITYAYYFIHSYRLTIYISNVWEKVNKWVFSLKRLYIFSYHTNSLKKPIKIWTIDNYCVPHSLGKKLKKGATQSPLFWIGLGNDSWLNLHMQMHTVVLHYIGYLHAGKLQWALIPAPRYTLKYSVPWDSWITHIQEEMPVV